MTHMSQFPAVVEIDGREWLVCPYGGPRCGRVLVDFLGALDVMDVHVRRDHVAPLLAGGRVQNALHPRRSQLR